MTKFLTKAALAATVATGLFAAPAFAADSEPFTATARIVSPLSLSLDNGGLNFGTITKLPTLTATGSDVVVGRSGGTAVDDCGTGLACTAPTAAQFSVSGSDSQDVDVTLAFAANPGKLMNGSASVDFVPDYPAVVSLDTDGDASFEIGGSITVTSATPDGTYSNVVDVTVEYS